jgi:UDP-GlcNAc:undecaprenyl-phosphate/decaprenyl-phosphate GlcNAc-1-phosphate transferase
MLLLVVLTSLVVSMAITPLMMRLAPYLHMVDMPDFRKVHAKAIPRVGGIGIVAGTLLSLLVWSEPQSWHLSYIFGSLVLLGFGAADDSMDLGHYTKFIGQFIAAIAVVYWGDVWVAHMPFVAHELPQVFGKPFTVFALVGVMNAINHSDGLDGLAGGETLLSLACAAYLGYLAGGTDVLLLAVATIGGVFGFLRFNTHPAQVFMGDAGSQFLGFTLGVVVVLLTQQVNSSTSMSLPLLIIGLPIIDILAVFAQRIYQRVNWFRATRNHIHHRLLDLGLEHGAVVVVIYSVQALFVLSAILFSYESDVFVAMTYLTVCASLFMIITLMERCGWRFSDKASPHDSALPPTRKLPSVIHTLPILFLKITVPLYLIIAGIFVERVPYDFCIAALVIVELACLSLIMKLEAMKKLLLRIALYSFVVCVVFLLHKGESLSNSVIASIEGFYFVLLGLAVAASLRVKGAHGFRTTPLDFLVAFVVLAFSAVATGDMANGSSLAGLIARIAVLFYACELLINESRVPETNAPVYSLIGTALIFLGWTFAIF